MPDALREGDGQVLKQSLTDDSRLDEDVVGVQLAPDGVAVFGRRAMEVLLPLGGAAIILRSRPHPEQGFRSCIAFHVLKTPVSFIELSSPRRITGFSGG